MSQEEAVETCGFPGADTKKPTPGRPRGGWVAAHASDQPDPTSRAEGQDQRHDHERMVRGAEGVREWTFMCSR